MNTTKSPTRIVSIARIATGTLLPAPIGAALVLALTLAADPGSRELETLAMTPLFALFGYSLVGLQSLASAMLLDFFVFRPARSPRTAVLCGAGLGMFSTIPLWGGDSNIPYQMAIGAVTGIVTAWAMGKAGEYAAQKVQ